MHAARHTANVMRGGGVMHGHCYCLPAAAKVRAYALVCCCRVLLLLLGCHVLLLLPGCHVLLLLPGCHVLLLLPGCHVQILTRVGSWRVVS